MKKERILKYKKIGNKGEKKHQVMKRRKNIKIQESWKERGKETPSDEKNRKY